MASPPLKTNKGRLKTSDGLKIPLKTSTACHR
nr:MAG TPA: hypothetical protein [Bacteriophage sp.]